MLEFVYYVSTSQGTNLLALLAFYLHGIRHVILPFDTINVWYNAGCYMDALFCEFIFIHFFLRLAPGMACICSMTPGAT